MNQLTITPTHYDAGIAESEETLQFLQLKVEFIKRVGNSNQSAFIFEKVSSGLYLKKTTPLGRLFYGLLRQKPTETTPSHGINKPSPKILDTLSSLPDGYEYEIQKYSTRFNLIAIQLGLTRAHFTGNPMHEMAPDLREGELINSFITRLREALQHPRFKANSVSNTRASINVKDDWVSTQSAQNGSQSINKAVPAKPFNLKLARNIFVRKNTPLTLSQYLNMHCKSRPELLDQLESFVNEVNANHDQPFVPCIDLRHKKRYAPSSMAKQHFHKLLEYIWILSVLPERFNYSEAINCLLRCCQAMQLMTFVDKPLSELNYWASPMKIPRGLKDQTTADLFNKLIIRMRADWKSRHCQARVNKRLGELDELYREYCQYTDVLFDDCARLLVLRVDLFYDKQFANTKTLPDIQKDLSHFIDNKRHNKIFNSLKGHIAKIEYGIDKGIHCHLLLFFDGFQRKNSSAVHFVKQLGEYWKTTITQGVGRYWNINRNARQYEKLDRLGIGVMNYHDTALRTHLKKYVIRYLCKTEQIIRPKFGDSIKLLRRGNPPKITVYKRGRPRKLNIEQQTQALSLDQN